MSSIIVKLGEKFAIKYTQSIPEDDFRNMFGMQMPLSVKSKLGTDPKKQLINTVGFIVPNGPEVRKLQTVLKQKNMNLAIDGIWGPESYNALLTFQKQNNLPADGKLNQQTVSLLGIL